MRLTGGFEREMAAVTLLTHSCWSEEVPFFRGHQDANPPWSLVEGRI